MVKKNNWESDSRQSLKTKEPLCQLNWQYSKRVILVTGKNLDDNFK